MEQRRVNPWSWQDQLAFSQAVEIPGTSRILFCAGQAALDGQGRPVHPGDMRKQIEVAFQNLEAVLAASDFVLRDVTKVNYYTTDVESFLGAYDIVATRLAAAGCQPASTLLGVARLAFPELLVEIEATAAK